MKTSLAYIGLVNPKSPENVGMVIRAAGCYEADKIFYTGARFDRARQFYTDTKNSHEKISLTHSEDLLSSVPAGMKVVAVELADGAVPLMQFDHPEKAYYLFGPEDGSLTQALLDACDHVVYVPTVGCMNLAATVNVVLYDRLAKSIGAKVVSRSAVQSRDTNNRLFVRTKA
ncbi:RNA methyltransferase [Cellvibrio sp.]|uniref:RNA methyltransferase n=1 Tax=Cellvibrio sp. TaxID=1965322 RepID=UPI0039647B13